MKRIIIICAILCLCLPIQSFAQCLEAGVFINELSNLTGEGEFIELVVVGDPDDPLASVNLKNWIIDDNNKAGANSTSAGHIRFGNCFQAMKPGSIIVIYNDLDPPTGLDTSKDGFPNAEGVYQMPISSPCFNGCLTEPNKNGGASYLICTTPIANGEATWGRIGMKNGGDAIQIRAPREGLKHAIYWSTNFLDATHRSAVEIAQDNVADKVISFSSGNWNIPTHYIIRTFYATPGLPNNDQNKQIIDKIKEGTLCGQRAVVSICEGECYEIGIESDGCPHWSPSEGVENPDATITNVCPTVDTDYELTITDEDGYLIFNNVYRINVQPIGVSFFPTEPFICGDEKAFIEAIVWGNEADYTFAWSTGGDQSTIEVAEIGTYTVTVTNTSTECTEVASIEVEREELDFQIKPSRKKYCGQPIELDAGFSVSPAGYSIEWSTGETGNNITINEAGSYTATLTNEATGCEYERTVIIEEELVDLTFTPETATMCTNSTLEITANSTATTFQWDQQSGNTILVTQPGEYSVTVTNSDACSTVGSLEVKDASTDMESIKTLFESKGFYSMPIEIEGDMPAFTNQTDQRIVDPCGNDCNATGTMNCVDDDAKLIISIQGAEMNNLEESVREYLEYFSSEFGYPVGNVFISKNENICACPNYFQATEEKFNNAEFAYWIHLYDAPDDGQDELFILTNVPTQTAHYPHTPFRINLLDESLKISYNTDDTGGLLNEAEQALFTVLDCNLDNFLSLSTEEDNPNESSLPLCGNALQVDQVAITPACELIQLPTKSALHYKTIHDWEYIIPDGALIGFTDLTNYESQGHIDYYRGRLNISNTPTVPHSFAGYYISGLKSEPYASIPYHTDVVQYDPNIHITFGRLEESNDPSYVVFEKYLINETYVPNPSSGITLYQGEIVSNIANCGILGQQVIVPPIQNEITLPPLTELNLDQIDYNEEHQVIFLTLLQEDGSYQYILASIIGGQITTYQWNCAIADYEEITIDNEAFFDEVECIFAEHNQNVDNAIEEEDEDDIGDPMCFFIPKENVPELPLNPANSEVRSINGYDAIFDYAGLGENLQETVNIINHSVEIQQAFIYSASPSSVEGIESSDIQSAEEQFINMELSSVDNSLPDVLLWYHYFEDGRAGVCVRLATDYFDCQNNEGTCAEVTLEVKKQLKSVIAEALFEGSQISIQELYDTNPNNNNDEFDSPPVGEGPWFFGYRESQNIIGLSNKSVISEILNVGGVIVKTQAIPDELWKKDATKYMFDAPGGLLGMGEAIVQENAIVGLAQMLSLGVSFVKDEKVREGLWMAAKNPVKTIRGIYQEKLKIYGGLDVETKYNQGAKDIVGLVTLFYSAQGLVNLINSFGKKADDRVAGLADEISDLPTPNNPPNPDVPTSLYDEIAAMSDDIDIPDGPARRALQREFAEFMAEVGKEHLGMFAKNPKLAKVWKKYKDDLSICNLFTDGSPEESEVLSLGACSNQVLAAAFKKLDGGSPEFSANFRETFLDINGDVKDNFKTFLKDIKGDGGDALLNHFKGNPKLLKAWDKVTEAINNVNGNTIFAKDIPTLNAVSKMIDEYSNFRINVGTDWENVLKSIIKKADQSPCSSCPNGRVGRTEMGQYLEDVNYFIENFDIIPGSEGNTFYNHMRGIGSTENLLDELHQTLNDLALKQLKENDVVGFGNQFQNGTKKFDVLLTQNKYIEYKNKDFVTHPLVASSDDFDQFLNGYLKNINSINDIEWKAGIAKLKKKGWTDTNAITNMKLQFKNVFLSKQDEILDVIWDNDNLKNSLFSSGLTKAQAKVELLEMIDNLDDDLFKFIKVG